jgi:hypothetical protein
MGVGPAITKSRVSWLVINNPWDGCYVRESIDLKTQLEYHNLSYFSSIFLSQIRKLVWKKKKKMILLWITFVYIYIKKTVNS